MEPKWQSLQGISPRILLQFFWMKYFRRSELLDKVKDQCIAKGGSASQVDKICYGIIWSWNIVFFRFLYCHLIFATMLDTRQPLIRWWPFSSSTIKLPHKKNSSYIDQTTFLCYWSSILESIWLIQNSQSKQLYVSFRWILVLQQQWSGGGDIWTSWHPCEQCRKKSKGTMGAHWHQGFLILHKWTKERFLIKERLFTGGRGPLCVERILRR